MGEGSSGSCYGLIGHVRVRLSCKGLIVIVSICKNSYLGVRIHENSREVKRVEEGLKKL